MKKKGSKSLQLTSLADEEIARSLLIGLALSAILLWTSLRAAQDAFPEIQLKVTLLALPTAALAALMLAALSSGWLRARILDGLQRYSTWMRLGPTDVLLITFAPLLSLGASVAAGTDPNVVQPAMTALLWTGALVCALKPAIALTGRQFLQSWPRWEIAYLSVVTLAALLLRGVQLAEIPWLLTGDEASAGLSAAEFLDGVWNNPFNIAWFSFPSLYFVLPASSIYLLGQTELALRLPSALAGGLTVLATYSYARRAFGRRAAVVSSAFLAGFHFHIHFSRIGLNNIWDGLFFVLVAGTLWRAWVSGRTAAFIWPGVALGFSLYFYATARILPVLVLLWLLLALVLDRSSVRTRASGLLVLLLASLAAVLPLVLFFAQFPEEFTAPLARVGRFSTWFQEEVARTGKSFFGVIIDQIRLSVLAFFSVDLRHWYIPDTPMLLPLSSTFFALGSLLLILRSRDLRYAFLALWLLSAIATGTISESTPASQRYLYVAPAVAIILALPLAEGLGLLKRALPGRDALPYGIVGALLAAAIIRSLSFYFLEFSANHRFGDLNTETATAVGHYLQGWPPGSRAYFLGGRMGYYSHSTIPYLAPQVDGEDVYDLVESAQDFAVTGPTVFLVLPERKAELQIIEAAYPQGIERAHPGDEEDVIFHSFAILP